MLIRLPDTIFHQRFHLRINKTDKLFISIQCIMICNSHDPVKRIINNRIDMLAHRVVSSQCQHGSLTDFAVCQKILINKIALVCISRPDPAVSFDSINKKRPTCKTKCIFRNIPYFFKYLITTAKRTFFRKLYISEICLYGNLSRLFIRNKNITESTNLCPIDPGGLPFSKIRIFFSQYDLLFQITPFCIQCFFTAFSITQCQCILLILEFHQCFCCHFFSKIKQNTTVDRFFCTHFDHLRFICNLHRILLF